MAPIGAQGAVFAANPVGNASVSITFDWYATTQGEANLELAWSTDGGVTLHNIPITVPAADLAGGLQSLTNTTSSNTVMGSYVSDNLLTGGSMAGQDWLPGLSGTVTDPTALASPNFAFYLVNASTGADDVSTQGTALNNTSGNCALTTSRLPEVFPSRRASACFRSVLSPGFAAGAPELSCQSPKNDRRSKRPAHHGPAVFLLSGVRIITEE